MVVVLPGSEGLQGGVEQDAYVYRFGRATGGGSHAECTLEGLVDRCGHTVEAAEQHDLTVQVVDLRPGTTGEALPRGAAVLVVRNRADVEARYDRHRRRRIHDVDPGGEEDPVELGDQQGRGPRDRVVGPGEQVEAVRDVAPELVRLPGRDVVNRGRREPGTAEVRGDLLGPIVGA